MPSPNLDHALTAAQRAIDLAVQHALSHQPTHITTKGDRDVVTNIDVAVENLIRDRLSNWDPAVGFVGEENGASGDENTYWVLDPIDGTINFSHGSPLCAIALGLVHDDQPLLGVTAVPFLGHRYWAVTGEGAYRDGDPITVSKTARLDNALIGMCDYGSGPDASTRDRLCSDLDQRLTGQAQGVRRLGTTALELVWVADGTLDASILFGNRAWDTASGAIIAREAGALVLDADGSPHSTRSRCTLATTPALAEALVPMMEVARNTTYWPQPAGTP
ncbi:inositol monophosphatase family protein [Amycolatopsis thailandensis]|uniref:inositol monophosphatase family protein n=1 Tax=Amycolatopsis thailandensis TaxID=589330 RepID=UPI00364C7DDC